ncbi:VWA domain-containing protein [Desulfonema magnum]|uniref:von Willebrand factor A-like and SH3 domains-containing protein n=1 Tax=Desulfonema magnum TaxID=45655 RepID=A0A975BR00_9BACT|nr:VWA domain-containing protein [Desulfonema magnum]QTA89793.1 von Willebrand factor A-like and SH3 domains-containing protein [Desulfonema magnum]
MQRHPFEFQINPLVLTLFLILVTLFVSTGISRARVSTDNLIFILDASGSMEFRINGKTKIGIVRDILTDQIKTLPASLQAGLVAYGHRHKGDCNDVEELVPVSPMNAALLIKKIRAITPTGMTSVSLAIRNASEKIRHLKGRTAVILIADGQDSCMNDPCALVRELKAKGIKFAVHVIGFDVTGDAEKQLSGIAQAGQGGYFRAGNAKELKLALKKTIKKLGIKDRQRQSEKKSEKKRTVPSQMSSSQPPKLSENKVTLKVNAGRIRKAPSLQSDIKFSLKKGSTVSVIDKKEEWLHIRLDDGRTGWSHQRLFSLSDQDQTADAEVTREIRAIRTDLTSEGKEKVIFVQNSFHPPKIFFIEEDPPKVVCDFFDTRLGKDTDSYIKVNSKFIQKIRTGLHKIPVSKLRVVVDLVPNKTYELEHIFLKEKKHCVLIIKSARKFSDRP